MEAVECVVVGAGVVGLAVARALVRAGREVIIVEAADAIGTETSSRNSEVIHAGIYYKPGSLMARFCVAGRQALYEHCREYSVPFRNCGKLIVATNDEEAVALTGIAARAAENGVSDLRHLSASEALDLEPALFCTAALLSPSTGIIDSHAFMLSLLGDAEAAGAMVAFKSPVRGGRVAAGGIVVETGGCTPLTLSCRILVNSAGLGATALARHIDGLPPETVPKAYYAKGNYFALSGRSPFTRLIYPVPVPGGLGTHLTLDIAGNARFGPDVEWIETIDYSVHPERGELFYEAIRRYWPGLRDGHLQPGYAGIRPKITGPGSAGVDFLIQDEHTHGVRGLINLFGIESPGLTAALAIADHVADLTNGI